MGDKPGSFLLPDLPVWQITEGIRDYRHINTYRMVGSGSERCPIRRQPFLASHQVGTQITKLTARPGSTSTGRYENRRTTRTRIVTANTDMASASIRTPPIFLTAIPYD
jgi:hypothetical protein